MAQIQFAFCVHGHQPVGNLDHVFENACAKAYQPFLEAVRSHPHLKVVLHYSGSLLQWLEENRPEILDVIAGLAAEGRAEMMTGGFYEPILPIIPERDRLGQIGALTDYLRRRFAARPRGLWLTERVWQPDLIPSLRSAGVEYTIVDDNNFQQAGLSEEQSLGHFTARGPEGGTLQVFPINASLRRAIPFRQPEEVLEHLRELAGDGSRLALWADDAEKLGEWPGTHQWVYREGWLDRFFALLADNSDWVHMTTLSEFLDAAPPRGEVDLPPGSYAEMMEWSGGSWQNFLDRYPESDLMVRKMRLASDAVDGAPCDDETRARARDLLYRGQSNCPYWHGVFGGLYLLHLRLGNYRNLIAAENLVSPGAGLRVRQSDFDGDGRDEVLVSSPHLNLYLHRTGGQAFELDHRAAPWNLLATLARRREPYHERLGDSEEGRALLPLHYDWYPRRSLTDHFLRADTDLDAFADCEYGEQGDFVNQPYHIEIEGNGRRTKIVLRREGGVWVGEESCPVALSKRLRLSADAPEVSVEYRLEQSSREPLALWFACESSFVLSAGNAPGRCGRLDPGGRPLTLDARAALDEITELSLLDEWLDCSVVLRYPEPTSVWTFPLQTVSQDLEGPTLSYQGSAIVPHWRITLAPGEPWVTSFVLTLGRAREGCV